MRAVIFISILLVSQLAIGQNFLSRKFSDRYFSLSTGTGAVTYFGDLNATNKINARIKLSTLGLEARLLSHVSTRIDGAYYIMEGLDSRTPDGSFEQQRNLAFESKNFEGTFQVIYYLKPYKENYFSRWQWDPYIGVGIGITSYNPYTELKGEKYFLRDIPTEPNKKYGNSTLIIPVTAGIKFRINDFTNLIFELGYRYTTTDYLDDVSTVFPESNEIFLFDQLANRRDEIAVVNTTAYDALIPGAQRGDNRKRDTYLFISLKAEIYLPKNLFSGRKGGLKKSSAK